MKTVVATFATRRVNKRRPPRPWISEPRRLITVHGSAAAQVHVLRETVDRTKSGDSDLGIVQILPCHALHFLCIDCIDSQHHFGSRYMTTVSKHMCANFNTSCICAGLPE